MKIGRKKTGEISVLWRHCGPLGSCIKLLQPTQLFRKSVTDNRPYLYSRYRTGDAGMSSNVNDVFKAKKQTNKQTRAISVSREQKPGTRMTVLILLFLCIFLKIKL